MKVRWLNRLPSMVAVCTMTWALAQHGHASNKRACIKRLRIAVLTLITKPKSLRASNYKHYFDLTKHLEDK